MPNFVDSAVKEIEDRIRALEDEASRLEAARAILAGGTSRRGRAGRHRATRPGASSNAGRSGGSAPRTRRHAGSSNGATSAPEAAASSTRTRSRRSAARLTSTANGRSASGATKAAVLSALAGGEAMTASQVATEAGLARPTVSTTLSKLAKNGAVQKAERGYRLASAA